MNFKKLIPLTFSAVSLVSIPSVVCSCGNQHQPDYTIRCDTKEITWSLSQTSKTEEFFLYTKDKIKDPYTGNIWWINFKNTEAILRRYSDKLSYYGELNVNSYYYVKDGLTPIYFDSLSRNDIPLGKYWLDIYPLWYEDEKHLQHVWFEFNLVE